MAQQVFLINCKKGIINYSNERKDTFFLKPAEISHTVFLQCIAQRNSEYFKKLLMWHECVKM